MILFSSLLLHLTHSAHYLHYQSKMIREDKDSRLNIQSNLIRDSTFIHNERDDHFRSSFKRRKRDNDSDNIYDFLLSLLSTCLFSIIISRRRANNVRNTHVMTNSIVFFSFSYSSSQKEDNDDENENESDEDDEMISRENNSKNQNNSDKYVDLRFFSKLVINFSALTRCIRK
jgi:hypothetical protein